MRTKKQKIRDINILVAQIVADAIEEEQAEEKTEEETLKEKPVAVALGRLGGLKGDKARAVILTAKKRNEIAKKTAKARLENKNKKP